MEIKKFIDWVRLVRRQCVLPKKIVEIKNTEHHRHAKGLRRLSYIKIELLDMSLFSYFFSVSFFCSSCVRRGGERIDIAADSWNERKPLIYCREIKP